MYQAVLYKMNRAGGFGVPNLLYYYKEAQIAPLIQQYARGSAPLCTNIDLVDVDPVPLWSLLWLPAQLRPRPLNPILSHSLTIWDSVKYSAGHLSPHLPLLEVFNCPWFPPGLDDPHSFHWWRSKGLTMVRSFLTNRGVYTFLHV